MVLINITASISINCTNSTFIGFFIGFDQLYKSVAYDAVFNEKKYSPEENADFCALHIGYGTWYSWSIITVIIILHHYSKTRNFLNPGVLNEQKRQQLSLCRFVQCRFVNIDSQQNVNK